MLNQSRAFRDASDSDSDSDDEGIPSHSAAAAAAAAAAADPQYLIFDAAASANRHADEEASRRRYAAFDAAQRSPTSEGHLTSVLGIDEVDADTDADSFADTLSSHFSRLNMTPFEHRPLDIVVQFFTLTGHFLWETQTMTAFQNTLQPFYAGKSITPLLLRYEIEPEEEEDHGDIFAPSSSAAAAAASAAAAAAADPAEPSTSEAVFRAAMGDVGSPKDDAGVGPPPIAIDNQIPESGYVVILVTVCGTEHVIIGLHRERFYFGGPPVTPADLDLDTFRVGGKRVAWREQQSDASLKCARTDACEDTSDAKDAAVDVPPSGAGDATATTQSATVKQFPLESSASHTAWNSRGSPTDLSISVLRNRTDGSVPEVRLALNIHIKRLRDEIRELFMNPEAHYPEIDEESET